MMPHHVRHVDAEFEPRPAELAPLPTFGPELPHDWRKGLRTTITPLCTLRELRIEDASSLCALLTTEEVSRFISPPPTTVEGFEDFIRWAHDQRARGQYACFGVVPSGQTAAVGLFQVCVRNREATRAEWGFVLGSAYWGTGIFMECARRVLEFVFTELPVKRLEALAVPQNGRGNGALRKVGAVRAGVLRASLRRFGERLDQALWIITRRDWLAALRGKVRETVH
jgi:RimJ/RimL family protein N-acetyltransferase